MHFTSADYFIFLIITLLLFWVTPRQQNSLRKTLFTALSFFFYSQINVYLMLLLFTTASIDFYLVKRLLNKKNKALLLLSVIINFLPLLLFKISPLFKSSITSIAIPIGISFYTFKSVSCIIDVYRGHFDRKISYLDYLFYLSFFPSLLCGPISRIGHFEENFSQRSWSTESFFSGLHLITIGLLKKLVIADLLFAQLSLIWSFQEHNFSSSLISVIGSCIQLTVDFSAYTDIAIGSALLFSYKLPENFNHSLMARNIGDFWRRHHISLSEWFRDYTYQPVTKFLTLNKLPTTIILLLATTITFLLSGAWHGLNFNGLLFGALQAAFISAYFLLRYSRGVTFFKDKLNPSAFAFLSWALTLTAVSITIQILVSPNWQSLERIAAGFAQWGLPNEKETLSTLAIIVTYLAFDFFFFRLKNRTLSIPVPCKAGLYAAAWCAIIIFSGHSAPFIYYRF